MDTVELAAILLDLARRVRLQAFRKGPRTPKKPNPQGKKTPRKGHVSTAQLLIVPLQRRISMPIMPQRSGVPCAENVPPFDERPIRMPKQPQDCRGCYGCTGWYTIFFGSILPSEKFPRSLWASSRGGCRCRKFSRFKWYNLNVARILVQYL